MDDLGGPPFQETTISDRLGRFETLKWRISKISFQKTLEEDGKANNIQQPHLKRSSKSTCASGQPELARA